MSIGIGARANLINEDENTVIFEYGSYNLNDPEYRNESRICDGRITIRRDCFVEPEVHEKMKKMPSGKKKLIVKRVPIPVHYEEMLNDGRIIVDNSSNCWSTFDDNLNVDVMACRLLYYIFQKYQEDGRIPEEINYSV